MRPLVELGTGKNGFLHAQDLPQLGPEDSLSTFCVKGSPSHGAAGKGNGRKQRPPDDGKDHPCQGGSGAPPGKS